MFNSVMTVSGVMSLGLRSDTAVVVVAISSICFVAAAPSIARVNRYANWDAIEPTGYLYNGARCGRLHNFDADCQGVVFGAFLEPG